MPTVGKPAALLTLLALLLLSACGQPSGGSTATGAASPRPEGPLQCVTVAVPSDSGGDEPDLTQYGYPQVAATHRFTPGQSSTVAMGAIVLSLPPDLYTDPLEFELLIGDSAPWQSCIGDQDTVMAPYAYRVRDPATGKRVGRFDKPVTMTFTDERVDDRAVYWITTATSPVTAEPSNSPWEIEGSTLRVTNSTARRGWFVTVPKS